ncbi:hypothetical protein PROFUN_12248 [Planoprotostelium fungivorum]|uniref:Uncharacterized protein n=1 Tax=Planoprotostelium fungivorum TaxID=1890364 RepID=A0A2P6N816_9EUKA|nr:hypothetical protein PROFUN_12248 [Planoprotostelium fungivorum]
MTVPTLARAVRRNDYRDWARMQNWAWGTIAVSAGLAYGIGKLFGKGKTEEKKSNAATTATPTITPTALPTLDPVLIPEGSGSLLASTSVEWMLSHSGFGRGTLPQRLNWSAGPFHSNLGPLLPQNKDQLITAGIVVYGTISNTPRQTRSFSIQIMPPYVDRRYALAMQSFILLALFSLFAASQAEVFIVTTYNSSTYATQSESYPTGCYANVGQQSSQVTISGNTGSLRSFAGSSCSGTGNAGPSYTLNSVCTSNGDDTFYKAYTGRTFNPAPGSKDQITENYSGKSCGGSAIFSTINYNTPCNASAACNADPTGASSSKVLCPQFFRLHCGLELRTRHLRYRCRSPLNDREIDFITCQPVSTVEPHISSPRQASVASDQLDHQIVSLRSCFSLHRSSYSPEWDSFMSSGRPCSDRASSDTPLDGVGVSKAGDLGRNSNCEEYP